MVRMTQDQPRMSNLLGTIGGCFLFRDLDEETGAYLKFEDNPKLLHTAGDRTTIKLKRSKSGGSQRAHVEDEGQRFDNN